MYGFYAKIWILKSAFSGTFRQLYYTRTISIAEIHTFVLLTVVPKDTLARYFLPR